MSKIRPTGLLRIVDIFKNLKGTLNSSDIDLEWINEYNKAIENASNKQEILDFYTKNTNSSTANLIQSTKGHIVTEEERAEALKNTTVKAKAASVAMKGLSIVASTILNTLIATGISILISKLVELANSTENVREAAEGFNTSISDFNKNIKEDKKTISELNDRYIELSKGVGELGQNLSLSSSEYEEYKGIISQVSDIMPELSSRYNEQGEKIGFITSQLTDLNKEYEKYQKNQAIKFITSGNENGETAQDVLNNYKNTMGKRTNSKTQIINGFLESFSLGFANTFEKSFTSYAKKMLFSKLLTSSNKEEVLDILDDISDYTDKSEEKSLFGASVSEVKKMTDSEFETWRASLSGYVQKYQIEIDNANNQIRNAIITLAKSTDLYWSDDISDENRESISYFLSNITDEMIEDFTDENGEINQADLNNFISKVINSFMDDETLKSFDSLMSEKFNNMPYKEAETALLNWAEKIGVSTGLDTGKILNMFGIDGNWFADKSSQVFAIKEMLKDLDDWHINDLTLEELEMGSKIEIPKGIQISWDEFLIKLEAVKAQGKELTSFPSIIKDIEESSSSISKAYKEIASEGHLSLSTVQELLEKHPELKDKLVYTADGYKIEKAAIEESIDAMIEKYRLELNESERAALATVRACGISTEGYHQVTDSIYEAVKAKLTWLQTPENVIGMNIDTYTSESKKYTDLLASLDEIIARRSELSALEDTLDKDLFKEGQNSAIDSFQSKLLSLSDAMQKFKNGAFTSTDKIDLFQEFPELQDSTENLGDAIEELLNKNLEDLYKLLGDDIPDDLKELFDDSIDIAKKSISPLSDMSQKLDDIQSAYKTVESALKEYSKTGKLSLDTIQALFEMDAEYFGLLLDGNGNLSLTTEALKKLTLARIEDLAVSKLRELIDDVRANGEKATSLRDLSLAATDAEGSLWGLLYAEIADIKETDEVIAATYKKADAYRALADAAKQTATTDFEYSIKASDGSAKEIEDILKEKALNELKYAIDKIKAEIEETADEIDILDDHLELTFEDDFVERIELTSDKLSLVTQHGAELRAEFERLAQIEPQTAAEAQELQSRMEELGQQIQENIQDVRELTLELVQLRVDALISISDGALKRFKHEYNIINNSIKAMSGQSLMGVNFSVLPVIPKDIVEQQREINDRLIAEEKRYQEEIWKIRKKYIELDKAEKDKDIAERLSKAGGGSGSGSGSYGSYGGYGGYGNYGSVDTSNSGNRGTIPSGEYDGGVTNNTNTNKTSDISNFKSGEFGIGRDALIAAARSQLGYMEGSGNANKFSAYGLGLWHDLSSAQAWCNDFVSWAATMAGLEKYIPLGSSTGDTANRFGGNLVSASGYIPKPGDIAYFGYGANGHVEIVTEVYEDGRVKTIGGNTGDGGVYERVRSDQPSHYGTYDESELLASIEKNVSNIAPTIKGTKTTSASWSAEKLKKTDLTQLPKLTEDQIETVIEKFFTPKNSVVKSSDSKGIYDAQTQSGISALALLGIGALESGYGTSSIAKKKGNLWGWGAVNSNPMGGAKTFADEVGQAAIEYAENLKSLYYDERGAKSIYAIGTGDNPSGLGYAYNDDGSISTTWANDIGSIMKQFIDVAGDSFIDVSDTTKDLNKNLIKFTDTIKDNVLNILKSDGKIDFSTYTEGFHEIINTASGEILKSADGNEKATYWDIIDAIDKGKLKEEDIKNLYIKPLEDGEFKFNVSLKNDKGDSTLSSTHEFDTEEKKGIVKLSSLYSEKAIKAIKDGGIPWMNFDETSENPFEFYDISTGAKINLSPEEALRMLQTAIGRENIGIKSLDGANEITTWAESKVGEVIGKRNQIINMSAEDIENAAKDVSKHLIDLSETISFVGKSLIQQNTGNADDFAIDGKILNDDNPDAKHSFYNLETGEKLSISDKEAFERAAMGDKIAIEVADGTRITTKVFDSNGNSYGEYEYDTNTEDSKQNTQLQEEFKPESPSDIIKVTDMLADRIEGLIKNGDISSLRSTILIKDNPLADSRTAKAGSDYSIINSKTGENVALLGNGSLESALVHIATGQTDISLDDLYIKPHKKGDYKVISEAFSKDRSKDSAESYGDFRIFEIKDEDSRWNIVYDPKGIRDTFSDFNTNNTDLLFAKDKKAIFDKSAKDREKLAKQTENANEKEKKSNKELIDSAAKDTNNLFDIIKEGLSKTQDSIKNTISAIKDGVKNAANYVQNHPIDIYVRGGDKDYGNYGSNYSDYRETSSSTSDSDRGRKNVPARDVQVTPDANNKEVDTFTKSVDTPQKIRQAVTNTWSKPKNNSSSNSNTNTKSNEKTSTWNKVKTFVKGIFGFATGTDEYGLPDSGVVITGEKGVEGGILPDGTAIELKKGLVDLPEGTQILTHEQYNEVKKYEGRFKGQKIPRYESGTGVKIPNPNDLLGMPLGEAAKVLADAFKAQYEEVIKNHVSFNNLKGISLSNEAEIDSKIKEHVTKTGQALTIEEMQKMAGELSVGMPSTLDGNTEQDVEKYLQERQKKDAEQAKLEQEYLAKFDMYIQEVVDKAQEFTEEELKHWRELDNLIDPITEKAHSGLDKIKAKGGTSEARAETSRLYKEVASDYYSLMKETMDWQKSNILRQYKEQMDILDKMYEYFDARSKSEDVTADELKILKNGIEEQQNKMSELSEAYIEAANQISEFVINSFKNAQLRFQSMTSYNNRAISDAQRDLNNSTEYTKKDEAYNNLAEAYKEEAKIQKLRRENAHIAREKWQEDLLDPEKLKSKHGEQYAEMYAKYQDIFDTVDFEALFDANGEFTEDKENLLKLYQDEFNIDATLLNNLLNELQTFKKDYHEAFEAEIAAEDAALEAERERADFKVSLWTEYLEKQAELYDFIYNREQAIIDSKKTEYELAQQIRQSISDATNTLEANKELEQWLDPETRKLLFNDEDYAKTIETYNKIQEEIASDTADYQAEIAKLTKDEWYKEEQITAAYQAQLEAHRESLEVATKELEVSKKRLEYENRAKERDTQIILGNRVINVADPEAMHNLAREKVQLESDYTNTLKTHAENQEIRDMQELNNATKAQSSALQANADMWGEMTEAQRRELAKNLPLIGEISSALSTLTTTSPKDIREFNNTVRKSWVDLYNAPNIGYGTDVTQDYKAIEDIVEKYMSYGIISKETGKTLLAIADDARERKRAEDHDYYQYQSLYNGGVIPEQDIYTTDTELYDIQDKSVKNYGEEGNYQERINKILDDAKGRVFLPSELEELKRLETKRNKKIYDQGLSETQTDDYGGTTFTDWDGDYSSSIANMEKRIALAGRKATESEIALLKLWEKDRNAKIDNDNLPYEKTYKYNFPANVHLEMPKGSRFILDGVTHLVNKDFNSDDYTTDKIASGELVPLAPYGIRNKKTAGLESEGGVILNGKPIEGHVVAAMDYFEYPLDLLPVNLENAGTTIVSPEAITGISPMLRSIYEGLKTHNNYNFGDIIITEPIEKPADFAKALLQDISNKMETTNNMSHN